MQKDIIIISHTKTGPRREWGSAADTEMAADAKQEIFIRLNFILNLLYE